MKLSPVQVDGWLYVGIAVFGTATTIMSSDESYKYVSPYILYWGKFFCSLSLAGCTALKMFRSTAYSDHLKTKTNGDTTFTSKEVTQETTTLQSVKETPTIAKVIPTTPTTP